MTRGVPAFVTRRLETLRSPRLFLLAAALFVVDLLVPDAIPFADEILLALATAFFARRKR